MVCGKIKGAMVHKSGCYTRALLKMVCVCGTIKGAMVHKSVLARIVAAIQPFKLCFHTLILAAQVKFVNQTAMIITSFN